MDYLKLDKVLQAQEPLSDTHDEMLFIIQHQTSELWIKLAIYELTAARNAIRSVHLAPAFKMLARVARIFKQLNNSWDVLRTMTPSEYTQFHDTLGQSSGFQSWQYRLVEYVLGKRNAAMLQPHAHLPDISKLLETELKTPSLYDETLNLLSRNNIDIPSEILSRDVSSSHQSSEAVGRPSTNSQENTGLCMNSQKNTLILRTIPADGDLITSLQLNELSGINEVPAAPEALPVSSEC